MSITLAPGETRRINVTLTALLPGWISPTGYTSPADWRYPWNAYDNNPDTVAIGDADAASAWTPWLELTFPGTPICSKVLLERLVIPQIYLIMDIYDGESYHRVDDGTILHTSENLEIEFTPQVVSRVRLKTQRSDKQIYSQLIGELKCWRIQ